MLGLKRNAAVFSTAENRKRLPREKTYEAYLSSEGEIREDTAEHELEQIDHNSRERRKVHEQEE